MAFAKKLKKIEEQIESSFLTRLVAMQYAHLFWRDQELLEERAKYRVLSPLYS